MINSKPAYTKKQMGDACEMLVAAEMTLAGVPALKVPDNWPGYDVIAQPIGLEPQRVSVKARTFKKGSLSFVEYFQNDVFDWLAVVFLSSTDLNNRKIIVIPRALADKHATRNAPGTKRLFQNYEILFAHRVRVRRLAARSWNAWKCSSQRS